MEFNLTATRQYSKHDKDGKDRNYLMYFLNGIRIFRQKIPFDRNYSAGFDRNTAIYNDYIRDGVLYQSRSEKRWCGDKEKKEKKEVEVRQVRFPLSKKILAQFNIPAKMRIHAK